MRAVTVACPCGEVYELKPEYAGRLLECPVCGRALRAPGAGEPTRRADPSLDPAFDRDLFLLRERLLTIRAKYEVWSEDGVPVCFVERPTYPIRTILAYVVAFLAATLVLERTLLRGLEAGAGEMLGLALAGITFFLVATSLRPKRHVTIYRNESRGEVLLRIWQDQRVALLTRTFTVSSARGDVLARLRKYHIHNLVRKRWYVETPGGERMALAIEDSIVLSLLRRVLGPLFGLLRTNFILIAGRGATDGVVIGEFNRKLTLLDRYVLDLRPDTDRRLDRRVALALGIMLDTGERR
ncbi:MAG TPA: hypothetical protein VLG10_08370 [Methylomirabilota bacterium]|nr:hypothetical protein [Methylomirabilota bacterium]